jgi:nitrate/nitrite transporter NarK
MADRRVNRSHRIPHGLGQGSRGPPHPADQGRFAGFSLSDGLFRPVYGYISEFIGRRRTMIYAYSGNVVFQLLAFVAGRTTRQSCSPSSRSSPAACPAPTYR